MLGGVERGGNTSVPVHSKIHVRADFHPIQATAHLHAHLCRISPVRSLRYRPPSCCSSAAAGVACSRMGGGRTRCRDCGACCGAEIATHVCLQKASLQRDPITHSRKHAAGLSPQRPLPHRHAAAARHCQSAKPQPPLQGSPPLLSLGGSLPPRAWQRAQRLPGSERRLPGRGCRRRCCHRRQQRSRGSARRRGRLQRNTDINVAGSSSGEDRLVQLVTQLPACPKPAPPPPHLLPALPGCLQE